MKYMLTGVSLCGLFSKTSGFPGLLATFILKEGWDGMDGKGWMGWDGWDGWSVHFFFGQYLENYLLHFLEYLLIELSKILRALRFKFNIKVARRPGNPEVLVKRPHNDIPVIRLLFRIPFLSDFPISRISVFLNLRFSDFPNFQISDLTNFRISNFPNISLVPQHF